MSEHDPYAVLDDPEPSGRETDTQIEAKDFIWLMESRRGRRVVWRLLDKAGVFRLSYTGDAAQTFFNEGQRNLGQQLMALVLRDSPDRFMQMLQEHEEHVRRTADPARS